MNPAAQLISLTLNGAFTGRGWQGATLTGAIRGMTSAHALWRPSPGRRCAWEHVLHCAYWKHAVRRAITTDHVEPFERSPSNWPAPPTAPDEAQWKRDRALLARMHALLLDAALALPAARLHRRSGTRRWTAWEYIAGIAAHDAYHTGQIQLLKRLRRS